MSPAPLRLHVVTEEDPFYIPVFFAELFDRLPRERFTVSGVDITPPLNQKTPLGLARKLYRFYGGIDFLRLAARLAAVRVKDLVLPPSRRAGTLSRILAGHGIASRVVSDVNAPAYVERLRGERPDLLLSVAASQIFKKELLSVPRLDAINIHSGTLPAYRGMLPVFWQMLDGQPEIGITIHTMTTEIDVGEVLLHRRVPRPPAETLDGVIRHMKREGARAMLELLDRYAAGRVERQAMDRTSGRYRTFPGRAEAAAFRRMGYRLL